MTDKCFDFFEKLYSNCGKEKRDEQSTDIHNNVNSICTRTGGSDEKILSGEQAECKKDSSFIG